MEDADPLVFPPPCFCVGLFLLCKKDPTFFPPPCFCVGLPTKWGENRAQSLIGVGRAVSKIGGPKDGNGEKNRAQSLIGGIKDWALFLQRKNRGDRREEAGRGGGPKKSPKGQASYFLKNSFLVSLRIKNRKT